MYSHNSVTSVTTDSYEWIGLEWSGVAYVELGITRFGMKQGRVSI